MRGTDHVPARCAALTGKLGQKVSCGIYEWRPSPCREFEEGSDACNLARRRHGLLQPNPAKSPTTAAPSIVLREPQPGDLGWVVQQHGEIYAREYGWNQSFEGLVADVIAKYQRDLQPDWERAWIAEVNGEKAGSVFVVRKSKTVAQLRLLILTPQARGLGLGGAADRRSHHLLARQGVQESGALDEPVSDGCARHLRQARFHTHTQ
jgi:hypothetical protein